MRVKLVITVLCIVLGALVLVEGKSISKENGTVDLLIHFDATKRSLTCYFLGFQPNSKLKQRRNWKKRNTARWPNLNPRMKRVNQKTVGDLPWVKTPQKNSLHSNLQKNNNWHKTSRKLTLLKIKWFNFISINNFGCKWENEKLIISIKRPQLYCLPKKLR